MNTDTILTLALPVWFCLGVKRRYVGDLQLACRSLLSTADEMELRAKN